MTCDETYARSSLYFALEANLSISSDGLHVANVGSSGNDGIQLLLPQGLVPTGVDVLISDTGLGTVSSPIGAFLKMTSLGAIAGISGQSLSHFTATTMRGGALVLRSIFRPSPRLP